MILLQKRLRKEGKVLTSPVVGLLSGLLAVVFGTGAIAAPVTVDLCTAGIEGNYFAAGKDIAAHASPKFLQVSVVETSGSVDNMQRMAGGECGAAIVQSDAFLVYHERRPRRSVEITRNRFLYAEFAHLVCRRDAKVATSDDLLRNPQGRNVLVGARYSGSALTWDAFTLLDRRYEQLATERVGGEEALDLVLNGQAQCLFFVSGLGSEFGRRVDQRGEDLRLVPIRDNALRNAEFGSVTPYETRFIPKRVYNNLAADFPDAGVETLSVSALLVISRDWSDRYRNGPSALLGAVTGAMPAISQRATPGFR